VAFLEAQDDLVAVFGLFQGDDGDLAGEGV
jgi:hypothetical protein